MRALRLATLAVALVAPVVAPARADQILGPGRIVTGTNAIVLPGGPTLGLWSSGKYIATPDALQIKGAGSTGDISLMSFALPSGAVATVKGGLTPSPAVLPACAPGSTAAPVPAGQPFACGGFVLYAQ